MDTLDHPAEFILYSIDPRFGPKETNDFRETFHDFQVMGKAAIKDPAEQAEFVQALAKGMVVSEITSSGCFNPRHAIRAKKGTNTVEILICFQCESLILYPAEQKNFCITDSARPVFEEAVKRAGLPVAKSP